MTRSGRLVAVAIVLGLAAAYVLGMFIAPDECIPAPRTVCEATP